MPRAKHHNPKLEMAHTWSWECIRQRGNKLDKYRQKIVFHVAEEHKPGGMSMKARIRDTRARWTAVDEFYIPPDPKYNKPPTPHEIRAEAARRREGGKGDADSELLPELDSDPRELILEGDREEGLEREAGVDGAADEVSAERRRHEVSLLDLPRGRIHRKEKKSTASRLDGDFEWIGRNRRGGLDEQWDLETIGEREVWDELEEFLDEEGWEALSDEEDDVVKHDGRGQAVRGRALTYAEKVRGKAG